MDEARRVLARLERIESLDRERVAPALLLSELRSLLTEAEAWARIEHPPEETLDAVERTRQMLQERGRTLVA